jgi:hypothetical protein
MIRALGNVAPRHLLDTRLHPLAEHREAAAETRDIETRPLPLIRR